MRRPAERWQMPITAIIIVIQSFLINELLVSDTHLGVCVPGDFPASSSAPLHSPGINRTSRRALIRRQIVNIEYFLCVGFSVRASCHRPCDSGAASSSERLASHLYISRCESERESGCGSQAWTGYYCSNINTPPKTDPRSNTNNCHIMCYIDRKHLPPRC